MLVYCMAKVHFHNIDECVLGIVLVYSIYVTYRSNIESKSDCSIFCNIIQILSVICLIEFVELML